MKDFARRSECYFASAPDAFEQPTLKLFLERPDLLTDRGLSDKVTLGCQREALKIDEVTKYLEGFDMHPPNINLSYPNAQVYSFPLITTTGMLRL